MRVTGHDSLKVRQSLDVDGVSYDYFSIPAASKKLGDLSRLPFSLKVLAENLLRFEDGNTVQVDHLRALADWVRKRQSPHEIAYRPARVLMQDFTGVPAVVDLAAMREAMVRLGGDPKKINPLSPCDLVIDHSVQVDAFGGRDSFKRNVDLEYQRNGERYAFLRWGSEAFDNFRCVPPGTGICHQVNLEHLSQVVWTAKEGNTEVAYPDTLVGTDSHTTMVNGLAVLGWGVGGIEAEAAMLGQPVSMLIPEVIGFKLHGELPAGATATDLVLTCVQMLRAQGVVGKFVEFYGPGVANLSLADRATIANMAPEYGATCGFFPIDEVTIDYLKLTGRDPQRIKLVEAYAKAQGMWRYDNMEDPHFTAVLELDLEEIEPSMAGPKRPQDREVLPDVPASMHEAIEATRGDTPADASHPIKGMKSDLKNGDVVIAAITSCTNTSNPSVMLAAGLVAKKAVEKGIKPKPWVKTSLAPGSKVVTDYLAKAGLDKPLNELGFDLVGYGCTTCIGNSGPLPEAVAEAVDGGKLVVGSVLSGNRNFEGRVHPQVKANYLASPPLVVAYSLLGTLMQDISEASLGDDKNGNPVLLDDVWPTNQEVDEAVRTAVTREMFEKSYSDVFAGDAMWQNIGADDAGMTYDWDDGSTYVRLPPYFEGMTAQAPESVADIEDARVLALLGDSITTDHISPAGSIAKTSPAADYLSGYQVMQKDFNSYGSRRGNHEVMMRGTFANIRLRNEMAPGTEGGWTTYQPGGEVMAIYDAAMKYKEAGTPLVIFGGKEYGTGSSRDWAAKGTNLLGVKAVITESFERIHRSNLVGMGVLPLNFKEGTSRKSLGLDGSETVSITGLSGGIQPQMDVTCTITKADGKSQTVPLTCRLDTQDEVDYYRHGGILHYVLRMLLAQGEAEGTA